MEDGKLAAKEIGEWSRPFMAISPTRVLDWGCGAGRIIRHLPALLPGSKLYGCDTNESMTAWNKAHYDQIDFMHIDYSPPTSYPPCFFDLVYGISIVTHIEAAMQTRWLAELHRILTKDAVLLLTTQGAFYHPKLLPGERKILAEQGTYTQPYFKKGHRMLSTYHTAEKFRELAGTCFTVLAHYDGIIFPGKIGGQDVWILRKKETADGQDKTAHQ